MSEEPESFNFSPIAVANYFVSKGIDEGSPIGLLKVVKLVYFAHGACLAYFGKSLFSEQVEAWNYGPVIPSVYHTFKIYGKQLIGKPANELTMDKKFKFRLNTPRLSNNDLEKLNAEFDDGTVMNMLDVVWRVYGKYSGVQLVDITHKKDSPWETEFRDDAHHIPIPNDKIEKYFQKEGFRR
ncbi:MAG: DUF4065 domain-containing protein [Helicobacteraceae bacterium]|jgi:uncharacterized phage-associated protein|nr:DUF4065 domain-containing protein [Helicobacteraceae bacterium]